MSKRRITLFLLTAVSVLHFLCAADAYAADIYAGTDVADVYAAEAYAADTPDTGAAYGAGIASLTIKSNGVIIPLKAGDDGYMKAAAFIVVSGCLLLAALLIRRHRMKNK